MDGKPLILVVEQNFHNLELLNSHLKTLNYSCICAMQGVKAVILAQTHKPDLILLDMMLSDLSGSQIIDYLKQNQKTATIPIIAVMPFNLVEKYNHLFLTGADDHITKPYNFRRLEIVLGRYLSQLNTSNLPWE
ncbi:MAG: PleD family two-component system response regulator [Nodularia sp. CChRGM 3473]